PVVAPKQRTPPQSARKAAPRKQRPVKVTAGVPGRLPRPRVAATVAGAAGMQRTHEQTGMIDTDNLYATALHIHGTDLETLLQGLIDGNGLPAVVEKLG